MNSHPEVGAEVFFSCHRPQISLTVSTDKYDNSIEVFTEIYNESTFLQSFKHLIFSFMKRFLELQDASDNFSFLPQNSQIGKKTRIETSKILLYTKMYFKNVDSSETSQVSLIQDTLRELHRLLLFIDRISSIPEFIIVRAVNDSKCVSVNHHFFHLILDIWWLVTDLFAIIDSIDDFSGISVGICFLEGSTESLFHQVALILLWDLCNLSSKRFKNVELLDYTSKTPFHCNCIRELWKLLLVLLNKKDDLNYGNFWVYWNYITQVLKSMGDTSKGPLFENKFVKTQTFHLVPESFNLLNEESVTSYRLWMLVHLAGLWNTHDSAKVSSNYLELKVLVKSILNNSNYISDSMVRCTLKCSLLLMNIWEPNIEVPVLFLEYFLKHLNDVPESHLIIGSTHMCKTGLHWYNQIKEWTSPGKPNELPPNSNTFTIFLRLLISQLNHQSSPDEKLKFQRRLTGTIYPKITRKSVEELSEVGLYRLLSLLLILGVSGNIRDISKRIATLTSMVSSQSPCRKGLAWKSLFALMHLLQEKKESIEGVASNAMQQFNTEIECHGKLPTLTLQHDVMGLLMKFVEGIQDLIDFSPSLALSEHKLIDREYLAILPLCGYSKLALVFTTYEKVLLKLKSSYEQIVAERSIYPQVFEEQQKVAAVIETNVISILQQYSFTANPPPQVALVAAHFTELVVDRVFPLFKSKDGLSSLFNQFGLNPRVNSSVSIEYIFQCLSADCIVQQLTPQLQIEMLVVWIRSSLTQSSITVERFDALTVLIFNLPCIRELFPNQDTNNNQLCLDGSSHIETTLANFFHQCASKWLNKIVHQEKIAFRNTLMKIFVPVVNCVQSFLPKSSAWDENIRPAFRLSANLVLQLAPLFHTPGNTENLLPKLISTTILALKIVKEKSVSNSALIPAKETLPLFLQGLSQLSLVPTSYSARIIKDIISFYLPRFQAKQVLQQKVDFIPNHPLLGCLNFYSSSFTKEKTEGFIVYISEVIMETFLPKKATKALPTSFQNATNIVLTIMNSISSENKWRITGNLLSCILEYLMIPSVDSVNTIFLNQVLNYVLSSGKSHCRSLTVTTIQDFVASSLGHRAHCVFSILESLAAQNGDIVAEILPSVVQTVATVEEKRGAGYDQGLRNGVKRIYKALERK